HETNELTFRATDLSVTQRRITPFGTVRGTATAWPTSRGFVNGLADPTGLTLLGAREHDPALGRFLSVDPALEEMVPQTLEGYLYANNSPASEADPDGTCWLGPLCGLQRAVNKVVSTATAIYHGVVNTVTNVVHGIIDGIVSGVKAAWNGLKAAASAA